MLNLILVFLLHVSFLSSNDKLNFSANSLETFTEDDIEKQIFQDNVIITQKSLKLFTDKAIYYPQLDEIILIDNVKMYDIQDTLYCDSLVFYNKENKNFEAFNNVDFYQKNNQIHCQKLEYNELLGFENRILNIFDDARVQDSLRTILGDSIYVQYKDSLIHNIKIFNNGEVINNRYAKLNKLEKKQLIQDILKSKKIFIDFDSSDIRKIQLHGMAITNFNTIEDSILTGFNIATGDSIFINMNNNIIERMQIKGDARGEFQPEESNASIDSTIIYTAEYIDYHVKDEFSYLYDNAYVNYDMTELNGGQIFVDWEKNFLESTIKDSIYPSINGFGESPTFGDRMTFDLITKKGKISKGRTQLNDGYYIGQNIYQEQNDVFYVKDSQFTTCDSDIPHYYFQSKQMKVIPNDRIIAKPVVFYIQDLPLFSLPFAVFPNKNGDRISGWIMPSFGHRSSTGSYLEDLGYYYVPNDYSDYRILLDIQDRRGIIANHLLRYKRKSGKYWYNYYLDGRVEYDYKNYLSDDDKDFTNLSNSNSSKFKTIKWRHKQSFDPTQHLIVNYKYKSSIDPLESNFNDRLDQTQLTSMTYQKRWTKNSLSFGYEKFNDLYNGPPTSINDQYKYKWFTGPRLSFSMPQRKIFGEGDKLKNDIYISYGLSYSDGKETYTKYSCLDQDSDGFCDCEVKCSFLNETSCLDNEFDCAWEANNNICYNIDDVGNQLQCDDFIDLDNDQICDEPKFPDYIVENTECDDSTFDLDGDGVEDCYFGDEENCDSCIGLDNTDYPDCEECISYQDSYEGIVHEACRTSWCPSGNDTNNDGYCDYFIWDANENIDNSSGGAKNKITLSLARSIGWLTISPRINFTEDWIFRYKDFDGNNKNDFQRRLTWNSSLSLNTKIYGVIPVNIGRINSIRHKMTPQISFNYTPNLRKGSNQIDNENNDLLSGTSAAGLSEGSRKIRFSLANAFQMKVIDNDQINKIDFLTYNLTCSYGGSGNNINKFSLIDSKLSFKKPNGGELLFVHMQHDMYDEDSGPFLLKRGKPPRLKTLKAQMSSHFKIKGDNYTNKSYAETIDTTGIDSTFTMHNSILYMDKFKPQIDSNELWRSDLSLSVQGEYIVDNKKWEFNYFNLDTRTTLHLTKKWLLTYAVGVNLIDMKIKSQSFKFYRELHCWEFMFTWWPDGFGKGFQLSINVKHPDLQDLRVRSSSENKKFRN